MRARRKKVYRNLKNFFKFFIFFCFLFPSVISPSH